MERIGPKKPTRLYIRERMEKYPIDAERLSERMDTTPGTISKLLNGHMKMTTEWLANFADALNVSVPELFVDPNRPSADALLSRASEERRDEIINVIDFMLKQKAS